MANGTGGWRTEFGALQTCRRRYQRTPEDARRDAWEDIRKEIGRVMKLHEKIHSGTSFISSTKDWLTICKFDGMVRWNAHPLLVRLGFCRSLIGFMGVYETRKELRSCGSNEVIILY